MSHCEDCGKIQKERKLSRTIMEMEKHMVEVSKILKELEKPVSQSDNSQLQNAAQKTLMASLKVSRGLRDMRKAYKIDIKW